MIMPQWSSDVTPISVQVTSQRNICIKFVTNLIKSVLIFSRRNLLCIIYICMKKLEKCARLSAVYILNLIKCYAKDYRKGCYYKPLSA